MKLNIGSEIPNRRARRLLFARCLIVSVAALTATTCSAQQESKPMTFTYKKVGDPQAIEAAYDKVRQFIKDYATK